MNKEKDNFWDRPWTKKEMDRMRERMSKVFWHGVEYRLNKKENK